jgi:hypothetical protein
MIYVIAEMDPDSAEVTRFVKIGYADGDDHIAAALRRSNELQCGNPRKLVVIGRLEGDIKAEQALHRCFESARVMLPATPDDRARKRRTEWFRVDACNHLTAWVTSVRVSDTVEWAGSFVSLAEMARKAKAERLEAERLERKQKRDEEEAARRERFRAKSARYAMRCQWCGETDHDKSVCPGKAGLARVGDLIRRDRQPRAANDQRPVVLPEFVTGCRWCGGDHTRNACPRFGSAYDRAARGLLSARR